MVTNKDSARFEQRFQFIKDELLRKNISNTFGYIVFLIDVIAKMKPVNHEVSSLHKDMIVHAAIIVESCLHYCLKEYIDKGNVNKEKVMGYKREYKYIKPLYKIDNDREVCGVIKSKKTNLLGKHTQFKDISEACYRCEKILTKELLEDVNGLREARNNIHLASLDKVEPNYTKTDSDKYFNIANKVITRIEDKLSKIG